MERFRDRHDAGGSLGRSLIELRGRDDVVVLGLMRAGVPIAYEIALALGVPLDVLVVRKLRVPEYDEIAIGAIASGGIQVVDRHIVSQLGVTSAQLRIVLDRAMRELEDSEEALRGAHPAVAVEDRTVILADDALSTGSKMLAAVTALRLRSPARIVVATPVGVAEVCRSLRTHVDELHCLVETELGTVTDWYDDTTPTTEDEARGLLARADAHQV